MADPNRRSKGYTVLILGVRASCSGKKGNRPHKFF